MVRGRRVKENLSTGREDLGERHGKSHRRISDVFGAESVTK